MSHRLDEYLALLERSGLEGTSLCRTVDAARERQDTSASRVASELQSRGHVTGWQNKQLLAGRNIRLGKYLLLEVLGAGSMGVVFLAEHTVMRRKAAIKVLPPTLGQEPHRLARFLSEARAVAALDHPHIVRAFNVDSQGGVYYLVMEHVAGRSLAEVVRTDGPLEPHAAAEYARQVCEGLSHAHACGIVHRDVKPGNLLVDDAGQVKILDLGLALSRTSTHGLTTEQLLGTADYLSPEQALDSHNVDPRTDLYSLGCTLHFLLTGGPPFPAETLAAAIIMHQTQDPPDIGGLRAEQGLSAIPGNLPAIVARLMAKDPDDRYATAADAGDALADWLDAHPAPAPAGQPRALDTTASQTRSGLEVDRSPAWWALAGGAAVGACILALCAWWLTSGAQPAVAQASKRKVVPPTFPQDRSEPVSATPASANPAGAAARFLGIDVTTRGAWIDRYGKLGCDVLGDAARPPGFASLSYSGHSPFRWAGDDERALRRVNSPGRISGCIFSWKTFEIDVFVTDQATHRISLYLVDWDRGARVQQIEVLDATTKAVVDVRTASDFTGGQYFTWETRGHILFRITNQGPTNAVVSGVFFD